MQRSAVSQQQIIQEKLLYRLERRIFSQTYVNANESFELKVRKLLETDELIIEFHYTNRDARLTNVEAIATINNKEIHFNRVNSSGGKYVFAAILKKDKD